MKFKKLTRANTRKLSSGKSIQEAGIKFTRLENGDGKYSVNIMVDGVRVHRVIGKESEGTTRKQAEDYIEQARTDSKHDRLNLPKGRKTALGFEKAASEYIDKLIQEGGLDIPAKKQKLNMHLIPFFKDKPLSNISTFEIERYKKHRKEQGNCTPATINRELAVVSHLYSKAVEWQWITLDKKPIIKKYKENNARIVYLTSEQALNLLQVAKEYPHEYIYLFILIALNTGMRRSEILSIRIENIDTQKLSIYIPKAKAGARVQPITTNLAHYLSEHLKQIPNEQTFLFASDKTKTGHWLWPEKTFRNVVKQASLDPKEVTIHILRHTAITHLVQGGIDLPTVQRVSGHKTLSMVARYSHQNSDHIQTAMSVLETRYKKAN